MKEYTPNIIEKKWQKDWDDKKIYKTVEDKKKPKYYILDMFPYPSGIGLHVGHPKGYIATDIMARAKNMQGFNVLHPMGWDAFGLPAENYALENKIHPKKAVQENIIKFKKQLQNLGLTYDWDREIDTTDPKFYKWTQWIFLKLFEKGLAYESQEPINWCPSCKTGLANEDLEEGNCERCGSKIEKKPMRQWVLKITEYADRLLNDLENLPGWETSIKEMQRNWIGRKEGAVVLFEIKAQGKSKKLEVFTTRPDTLFGATFVVLSPEHDFAQELTERSKNSADALKYIQQAKQKTDLERTDLNKDKTGVILKGITARNPVNGEEVPVFLADYVLKNYGTGAIMSVPAHDLRDYEFAKKYNLPIITVVTPKGTKPENLELPYEEEGIMVNSQFLDSLENTQAIKKIISWLEEKKLGSSHITYRLQDWVFSRQRYWGEPIPVVKCEKCGVVPLKEEDLPLLLPEVEKYEPTGTGESPLAAIEDWVNTKCPKCNEPAKRETNTMPQWGGSSWYYLRYMDPKNDKELVSKEKEAYWSPVDQYVGGAEHATRHLIFARFWHKFLYDIGAVTTEEPFERLQHVGLIMGEDGRKMGKRYGNAIDPNDIIKKYGADSLRVYEMFMGPFNVTNAWNPKSLVGSWRFLERVWNLKEKVKKDIKANEKIESQLHRTIKSITKDVENFKFNTSIAKLMELVNTMQKEKTISEKQYKTLLQLLHPFAPHITEELWSELGEKNSIYKSTWPKFDEQKTKSSKFVTGILINGKLRERIEVSEDENEEEIKEKVLKLEKVKTYVKDIKKAKFIYIPGRILNIVTKK
jgi:leucyl-tRNA synthetase